MFSKRAFNARRRKTQALAKKPVKVANEKPTTEIFVNQTVIPFKKTCDFCEEKRAVFHCPKCTTTATGTGDFLCDSCDLEVHRHVKRRNHIRTQIPDVTAREAVHKIMGCFKYLLARKVLVAKCRLEFQRFFDPPTKTYFYFRPSIQVFNRRPMYFPRVAAMAYAPVRSVERPRRPERGRGAWRRSRSVFGAAAAAEPTLEPAVEPTSEPTAKPTNAHRRGEREHAIAARDKANTQNQTQETSWRKPLCLKEAELCPYPSFDDYVFRIQARPPRPRGLHSRRWRRMDAVARRWRGGGRGR